MTGNRMIGLCDILGFKDLVRNTPLDKVVNDSLGWLGRALFFSLHQRDFPEAVPTLEELQENVPLGLAWFSDWILFYTRDDTDQSVVRLLETLAWIHFMTIVDQRGWKTRLRSGVSYGPVHIDPNNSIFVGAPIIDAYELERSQEWAGGALTDAAAARLPVAVRKGIHPVVPYRVPVKGGGFFETLAINWSSPALVHPLGWRFPDTPMAADGCSNAEVARKFENTRKFHVGLCHDCKRD